MKIKESTLNRTPIQSRPKSQRSLWVHSLQNPNITLCDKRKSLTAHQHFKFKGIWRYMSIMLIIIFRQWSSNLTLISFSVFLSFFFFICDNARSKRRLQKWIVTEFSLLSGLPKKIAASVCGCVYATLHCH